MIAELNIPGLDNGWNVDGLVFRSAQPPDLAWPALYDIGVRSVVDLNNSGSDLGRQAALCVRAGLTLKAYNWDPVLAPNQAQIRTALTYMDSEIAEGRSKVLVHCQYGSDRTGTLLACWRMHHAGWRLEDALHEALFDLGFHGEHDLLMATAAIRFAMNRRRG